MVRNGAAWLVLKKQKRDHITPLLNELHWLPVKFRCEYKIGNLAYCHFSVTLPSYLSAFLCTYQTSCTFRSSGEKLLRILKRNLKSVGDRSFSFIALSGICCLLGRACVCMIVDYVYACVYICVNGALSFLDGKISATQEPSIIIIIIIIIIRLLEKKYTGRNQTYSISPETYHESREISVKRVKQTEMESAIIGSKR